MTRALCATLAALLLAPLVGAGCVQADGRAPISRPGGDDARRARLAENLAFEIPQLQGAEFTVGDLTPSEVDGLDRGSFTFRGETYAFLVTPDDARLYLLAREPFDASRTDAQLAEARASVEADAAQATRERAERLASVANRLPVRGRPDAPITIVEFADFQCPYCQRGADSLKTVLARNPDVRFAYLHFPLSNHPWARPAAIASVCAAEGDPAAFWTLHDRYFADQAEVTPENVLARGERYLAGSGVDLARWRACASDTTSTSYRAAADDVAQMEAMGTSLGVTGTPAFFVNGVMLSGAQSVAQFEEVLQQARRADG